MNFIYIILFLILLSCNTTKKEYVCGDHLCIDKKEFNEYFSKNLTIEIKSKNIKKNKKTDLVKLNTDLSNTKENNNKNSKKEEKIKKINEKEKLKAEKIRLIQERKIKKKNEKDKLKVEKIRLIEERKTKQKKEKNQTVLSKIVNSKVKSEKLAQNEMNNNKQEVNIIDEKIKPLKKITKKTVSLNSVKADNVKSVCGEIKNCDIEKIAELLIKNGKQKPYPNISSN